MINVRELRIGNLFCVNGNFIEVNEINEFSDDGTPKINGWDEEDIAPIPLSPEWLERLGFIKRPDKIDIWQRKRLSLWLNNGCLCYLTHEDHDNDNYYIPNGGIDYIHQLMNLHFALTGEELTIK